MRVSQNRGSLFRLGLKGKLEETAHLETQMSIPASFRPPGFRPFSVPFKGSTWLKWCPKIYVEALATGCGSKEEVPKMGVRSVND